MRLSRYFVFLFVITCFGLLYAHQQFLIVHTNYSLINRESRLSHLLDRNKRLMYNVTTLESPASLEAKLSATGVDYNVPARWEMVKRSKSGPTYKLAKVADRHNVVLEGMLNFLTAKAEARALEN